MSFFTRETRPADGRGSSDDATTPEDGYFRTLAESLPQLVWTTRPDGSCDYFNRRWSEFTGLSLRDSIGAGWQQALHPAERSQIRTRWGAALAAGKPFETEYRLKGFDGRYRWFLGRALPVLRDDGSVRLWLGTCTDIDGQKNAEHALRLLHEQHRVALEAADLGTFDYSVATGVISFDPRACQLFGLAAEGIRSLPLDKAFARLHAEDAERVRDALYAALDPRSEGRFDETYRIVTDGTVKWLHARGQAFIMDAENGPQAVRVSGVIGDVSEQRRTEEAQYLLTRELNHRVKNLFAIASGMVSMTARTAATPKEMAEALRGRLGALSRAHELIGPAHSAAGMSEGTTLRELAATILAPYVQEEGRRLILEGPDLAVGAHTTTSLALVLHELATNAAKYGSLSAAQGTVTLRWMERGEEVLLSWAESGGPAIVEPPSAEGFGSVLAQRSIAGQLGGTLRHDWRRDGLTVSIAVPVARLAQ